MTIKTFSVPKNPGACADLLYKTREKRLQATKIVDELKEQETKIKDYLIATLPKSDSTGVAGKFAMVRVVVEQIPQVEDRDLFYAHIKKTGSFELLTRALNRKSVEERWLAGKKVPGVGTYTNVKVSSTKL